MTSARLDSNRLEANKLLAHFSDRGPVPMLISDRLWESSNLRKLLFRFSAYLLVALVFFPAAALAQPNSHATESAKVRLAIVGLNHDHVWGILKDIEAEKSSELVSIAETDQALVSRAKGRVPPSVKFFEDFVKMLDEVKPDAVIATTSNDLHLQILRECALRHIHFSTEKPMVINAVDAREMARLAKAAGIKLMVNYWNAWAPPTPALVV